MESGRTKNSEAEKEELLEAIVISSDSAKSAEEPEADDTVALLPPDENVRIRRDMFESLMKKISTMKDDPDKGLDPNSPSDWFEQCDEEDQELSKMPEAKEDRKENRDITNKISPEEKDQLKNAVAIRTKEWKENGISFTFNRVDKWLKEIHTSTVKKTIDANGSSTQVFENRRELRSRHRTITAREEIPQTPRTHRKAIHPHSSFSDGQYFSDSSVDTAEYIRQNCNKRLSRSNSNKTIINKVQVIKQNTVIYMNSPRSNSLPPARQLAIESAKKRRRKKGKYRWRDKTGKDTKSESESESAEIPHRKAMNLNTTQSFQDQLKELNDSVNGTQKSAVSQSPLSDSEEEKQKEQSPSKRLSNISCSTVSTTKRIKKFPIYEPPVNEEPLGKIKINSEMIRKSLGEELAKELLVGKPINVEVAAKSKIHLEYPSTDSDDSDLDDLIKIGKKPKIVISCLP